MLKKHQKSPFEVIEKKSTPAAITYARPLLPRPIHRPQPLPQVQAQPLDKAQAPTQKAEQMKQAEHSESKVRSAQENSYWNNAENLAGSVSEGEGLPRSSKSSISGATFMRALRQSIYAEQRETRSTRMSPPSTLEERLEDWALAHYIHRTFQAIAKASRFSTKNIILQEDVIRSAYFDVPILKNGTLGRMADNLTGIPSLDELIKEVLKAADFPPIPKRFNQDVFIFKVGIDIYLKKGQNFGSLVVRI